MLQIPSTPPRPTESEFLHWARNLPFLAGTPEASDVGGLQVTP